MLLIALTQVKVGNTSEDLLNEIPQIASLLYGAEETSSDHIGQYLTFVKEKNQKDGCVKYTALSNRSIYYT